MRSFLSIALLAAVSITPAIAQEGDTQRRIVSVADLDLSRPHDRIVLQRRLTTAVDAVCGPYVKTSLLVPAPVRRCKELALNAAQTELASYIANKQSRVASR